MKLTNLCLLLREGEILLALKKRGFGQGKLNGVGGKIQPGETMEAATVREAKEEIEVVIDPLDLVHMGENNFYFPHKPEWNVKVVIYLCHKWVGEPTETEEMRPQWFKLSEIPYPQMWDDDQHWLPKVLSGQKIHGEFYFGPDNDKVERFEIKDF